MTSTARPGPTDAYSATTRQVQVVVRPRFLPEQSNPERNLFVWTYHVRIENLGTETVQLVARHWVITDAQNRVEEVRGPGVVGEQPVLKPGESYEYDSACPLSTESGAMEGSYSMVTSDETRFEATIPTFSLHLPEATRRLN
jgi:ApaG protein